MLTINHTRFRGEFLPLITLARPFWQRDSNCEAVNENPLPISVPTSVYDPRGYRRNEQYSD